jgi:hypothetical protein
VDTIYSYRLTPMKHLTNPPPRSVVLPTLAIYLTSTILYILMILHFLLTTDAQERCIDFCFASPFLVGCITRSGILAIDNAYMSDHRTLFLDLDIKQYFNGLSSDPVSRLSRAFTTKNEKLTTAFIKFVADE